MTETLDGQMSFLDLASPCGKTSPVPSAVTKERTSRPSSKRSAKPEVPTFLFLNLRRGSGLMQEPLWEMASALHGGSMMLNFGESPSVENASTLSQILQANVPEKYSLSPKACAGILKRAEKRGKVLPDMLRDALLEVVNGSDGCNCC